MDRCTNLAAERNPAAKYDGVVATVGRAVHYVAHGVPGKFPSVCRDAKITEVDEQGRVGIKVDNPTGQFFLPITHEAGPCKYSPDEMLGGTWHWPARV